MDDRGKAVLIYGFGVADDRRAAEKIEQILAGTTDTRLKIACWYALTRFGKDRTADMNAELGKALDGGEAAQAAAGDILTAFQWMRDKDTEKKIDRAFLKKALDKTDNVTLFFAQAIMQDVGEPLDAALVKKILALTRHKDAQVQERAANLLTESQASLAEVMKTDFASMSGNEKASLVGALNAKTYESVAKDVRPFIEQGIAEDFKGDETAREHIIRSVGTLKIKDLEERLIAILKDDYSVSAGIAFAMLYQDAPEDGKKKLSAVSSNAALVARAFLGDEGAVGALKAKIDGDDINDLLTGIKISGLLNNATFYSRYFKNIRYSNSDYEPSDYLVAYAAQTAAINLLVKNSDLRAEVRAKL